jgi:hypothetical protein
VILVILKNVNEKFFIGEEAIEVDSDRLKILVEKYKFSLESISILSHIEFNKLYGFYHHQNGLTYDEVIQLSNSVLEVFIPAIETSIHNYNSDEKYKKNRVPTIFED